MQISTGFLGANYHVLIDGLHTQAEADELKRVIGHAIDEWQADIAEGRRFVHGRVMDLPEPSRCYPRFEEGK